MIKLLKKRIKLNLLFKLLYLNSNFELTLGYFNPALNNSDLVFIGGDRLREVVAHRGYTV